MSEHDADKNPEPEHETAVKVEQPKAPAGGDGKLAGLMAEGDTSANAAKAGKAPARGPIPPCIRKASVTAGLKCAPDIGPSTVIST